jgi:hypothetical protein
MGFDDILGENHIFKNFFSKGFNILAVDTYSGVELCMPTWLNHDYEGGGLWIYWWQTHIPEWMYAHPYLWMRLAINVGGKSFSNKKIKTQMDTTLNKAQHKQELLCE